MSAGVAARLAHRHTEDGGLRLHWVEVGEGPLVVLQHGFPETWRSWRHQLLPLAAAGFRVVAPDLRGVGGSAVARDVEAYQVTRLADDLHRVIRACSARSAAVVGHDWGGAVAWALACLRPDVVDRLVIANCPHPEVLWEARRDPSQLRRSWYMGAFQLPVLPEAALRAGGFLPLRRALRSLAATPATFTDADLDAYAREWARPGRLYGALGPYRALGQQARRGGFGDGWDPISAPTMVIWGDRDRALGRGLAEPGRHRVSDLTMAHLPDAGHFVHADAPERFTTLVTGHLAPLLPAAAQGLVP